MLIGIISCYYMCAVKSSFAREFRKRKHIYKALYHEVQADVTQVHRREVARCRSLLSSEIAVMVWFRFDGGVEMIPVVRRIADKLTVGE